MEDIEIPTEHLREHIHHVAERHGGWTTLCALMSAMFAVLAAITGLQSGYYANQAMQLQIESADAWNYYQAKGIKAAIAELAPTGKARDEKIKKYHAEQETIRLDAAQKSAESEKVLERHEILARAVTLFQVGIAMIAIAVLMHRPHFLWLAAALGAMGIFFWVQSALG